MRPSRMAVLTTVVVAVALAGCGTAPPPAPDARATSTPRATATSSPSSTAPTPVVAARILPCKGVLSWTVDGVPTAAGVDTSAVVRTLLNTIGDVTPVHPLHAGAGYKAALTVPAGGDVVAAVLAGYGITQPVTTLADLIGGHPALAAADAKAVRTRCTADIKAAAGLKDGQKFDCLTGFSVLVIAGSQGSAAEGLALVGQTLTPALLSALPIKIRTEGWAPDPTLRGRDVIPPLDGDLVVVVGDVPGRVMDALPPKAIRISTTDHPTEPADAVNLVHDVLKAGYSVDHPATLLADLDGSYHHDGKRWDTRLAGADRDALRTGCGLDGA